MKTPEPAADRQVTLGRRRLAGIVFPLGLLFACFGVITLVPLALLPMLPSERAQAAAFWLPGLASVVLGAGLALAGLPGRTQRLTLADGAVIVLVTWIYAAICGAIPFQLAERVGPLCALFESVSGLTTTGLSVLVVERCGQLVLFWRSWLQFVGGAGFAVVMLAAIVGPFAPALYAAEGHTEPLLPNVRKSAATVLVIYCAWAVVGTALYYACGLTVLDAVNHCFAALSTGGFSTRSASIGGFGNPAVEAVSVVLMLAGSTNFLIHHALWKGHLRTALRSGEVRLAGLLLVLAIPALAVAAGASGSLAGRLRVVAFEAVSALTTTGFTLTSYAGWTGLGVFLLILLMSVGGAASSTAGGIKQVRVYLLFKSVLWEVRRRLLPRHAVVRNTVWRGDECVPVTAEDIRQLANFVFLYAGTYAAGVCVLMACGYDLRPALFEYASALATTGLSVGVVGPAAPPPVLWAVIAGMFLGRLEFLVVIVGLARIVSGIRDRLAARRRISQPAV